jgi:hypothetical protein
MYNRADASEPKQWCKSVLTGSGSGTTSRALALLETGSLERAGRQTIAAFVTIGFESSTTDAGT